MSTRTLILTESMQAHDVVSWQEAVTMLFNGKVRVLETYDEVIGRVRFDQIDDFEHFLEDLPQSAYDGEMIVLRTPAVMVLKAPLTSNKRGVKFSRTNVFTRDKFCCSYCGTKGTFETLNYDHVIPRAQGGKTVWQNIVTACRGCNSRKADRTPEQAGMKLLVKPHKPKTLPMENPQLRVRMREVEPVWREYLGAA